MLRVGGEGGESRDAEAITVAVHQRDEVPGIGTGTGTTTGSVAAAVVQSDCVRGSGKAEDRR